MAPCQSTAITARARYGEEARRERGWCSLPIVSVQVDIAGDLHGPGCEPVHRPGENLSRKLHDHPGSYVDRREVIDVVSIRIKYTSKCGYIIRVEDISARCCQNQPA